jgi:basic membrane protein A
MKKILSIFTVSFALVFSSSAFANKIGVVYDSGGKFDKSFNELAYESAFRVQN